MAMYKNVESSFETEIRNDKSSYVKRGATYITVDAFVEQCRHLVAKYINDHDDSIGKRGIRRLADSEVFVVWLSKTLQNHKGLFATPRSDGLYFEITYDGDKAKLYFDVYEKVQNNTIDLYEFDH